MNVTLTVILNDTAIGVLQEHNFYLIFIYQKARQRVCEDAKIPQYRQ